MQKKPVRYHGAIQNEQTPASYSCKPEVPMPVVTMVDLLGIQRYIYASNRLRDVVTGSRMVSDATTASYLKEKLLTYKFELHDKNVILDAGGNLILKFDTMETAKQFAAAYSRLLWDTAPGLEAVIAHCEYDDGHLAEAIKDLFENKIPALKRTRKPSIPIPGFSVTASCTETGLVASGYDATDPKGESPLSNTILKRRAMWDQVDNDKPPSPYSYPEELDHLGRTRGDTSFMAVVHIDGNNLGKRIADWLKKQINKKDDESLMREYKNLAEALASLGKSAYQACEVAIMSAIPDEKKVIGIPEALCFDIHDKDKSEKKYLPIRPILIGGDDITFVCDARVAFDATVQALKKFNTTTIEQFSQYDLDSTVTACAGIAIVPVHTPFIRAYEMAEELCSNAKDWIKNRNVKASALDWHIGILSPGQKIKDFRKSQYTRNGALLWCRPYCLEVDTQNIPTYRDWSWFASLLDGEKGIRGTVWAQHRNKIKELRALLELGQYIVSKQMEAWRRSASDLGFPAPLSNNNVFIKENEHDITPLADAIEIMDLYLNITNQKSAENEESRRQS